MSALLAFALSVPAQAEMSGPQRARLALKAEQASDAASLAAHPSSRIALTGSAILQFKQTFERRGNFETLMFQLELEQQRGRFGYLLLPRLKFANFDQLIDGSTLWLHQGYGFWAHRLLQIKLGKAVSVFGRVWDYGFYGPLLANNDVKLAPDIGLTVESNLPLRHHIELYLGAQYAPIDGRALAVGHGQALRLDARREHIVALRGASNFRPHRDVLLTVGVSLQRFSAVQLRRHQVLRAETDFEANWGNIKGFAELGLQHGADRVVSQNILITSNRYLWTGFEYVLGPASMRYHFNAIAYNDVSQTTEYLHQPGLALRAGTHCTFVAEMAFWRTSRPIEGRGERTLYLFAGGLF